MFKVFLVFISVIPATICQNRSHFQRFTHKVCVYISQQISIRQYFEIHQGNRGLA